MTQGEELGPLGIAGVAIIVGGHLVDTPSALSSMPTLRWMILIGLVCTAIVGIAVGMRDL